MDWNQSSLNLQVDEGDRRIFRYNTPPNIPLFFFFSLLLLSFPLLLPTYWFAPILQCDPSVCCCDLEHIRVLVPS